MITKRHVYNAFHKSAIGLLGTGFAVNLTGTALFCMAALITRGNVEDSALFSAAVTCMKIGVSLAAPGAVAGFIGMAIYAPPADCRR
jgi:hypothetical protein